MSYDNPRLRGSRGRRSGPYPFGEIPDSVIKSIGRQIVHRLAVGHGDITGDDFGTIFAEAVDGIHRSSPIGVADVEWNSCAWSVKTVKSNRPFEQANVRLISGRNSPDYSHGISDPRANINDTGRAVLSIWNARVNEALDEFDDLRIVVFIRNMDTKEFVIFEEEARRFNAADYEWSENQRRNFEGYRIADRRHQYTWQPHGGQFTVIRPVPPSAKKFSIIRNVPIVSPDAVLASISYRDDWVHIRT